MMPTLRLVKGKGEGSTGTPGGKHREDLYFKRDGSEIHLLSIEHHGDVTPDKLGHGGGWNLMQSAEVSTYLPDEWRFALWRLESAESSAGGSVFDGSGV